MAWKEADFIGIRRRMDELSAERLRAISGEIEEAPRSGSLSEETNRFLIYFDSEDSEICGQRDVLDRAAQSARTRAGSCRAMWSAFRASAWKLPTVIAR